MTLSSLQAATDVIDRSEQLMRYADTVSDSLLANDLRRHALAGGVAALDTYLHWALADAPLKNMPTALQNLDIQFLDIVELSEAVVRDRTRIRPKVRARGVLERTIRSQTFQSSRGVEQAMSMLGVRKAFNKIARASTPHKAPADIQSQLNRIVSRRNQIVHEGDLQRQSRPQRIRREPVDKEQISNDLVWLRAFIATIDAVLP